MMSRYSSFFLLIAFMGLTSCNQAPKSNESADTHVEKSAPQDVSQLTYQDVVTLVYDDEGEGMEWHGEEMPNSLKELLAIEEGAPCGEGNCGKRLSLHSSGDRTMTVIIKGDYDIKGDQGYIPRKYVIEPGQSMDIGCSHLCFGMEAIPFYRSIVGSAYPEE